MHPTDTKLRCLVVDDEEGAIEGLQYYIEQLDFLQPTATASSALEARDILSRQPVDLMLLDINMPHLSGLELLETLEEPPLVILTTAYSEYALEGYRLNVVDYLLKPVGFERFRQAARKALDLFDSRLGATAAHGDDQILYIRQGETFVKIRMEDILYAEGMQNYIKIHFARHTVVIHQTMNSLEELLCGQQFFRIHRSYLVNLAHIESISTNRVRIGQVDLPLSSQRRRPLLEKTVDGHLISK